MFLAYWPVLGFVVGLVLVAVFTSLLMASRVCRARHETLPERPLQSYLPDTVSPDYSRVAWTYLSGLRFSFRLGPGFGIHSVPTYKGQHEFETRVSQNFPKNLTSHVPKLSQISFKLSDVSNLILNGHGKK